MYGFMHTYMYYTYMHACMHAYTRLAGLRSSRATSPAGRASMTNDYY